MALGIAHDHVAKAACFAGMPQSLPADAPTEPILHPRIIGIGRWGERAAQRFDRAEAARRTGRRPSVRDHRSRSRFRRRRGRRSSDSGRCAPRTAQPRYSRTRDWGRSRCLLDARRYCACCRGSKMRRRSSVAKSIARGGLGGERQQGIPAVAVAIARSRCEIRTICRTRAARAHRHREAGMTFAAE